LTSCRFGLVDEDASVLILRARGLNAVGAMVRLWRALLDVTVRSPATLALLYSIVHGDWRSSMGSPQATLSAVP